MKAYADYEYYVEEFGSKMSADDFRRYSREASSYIRQATLGRSDAYEGEELQMATCAVAEIFSDIDKSCIGGRLIASENNDGFSVSFANSDVDSEKLKSSKAYQILKRYLGGTGLLNRRVACANKCGYHNL